MTTEAKLAEIMQHASAGNEIYPAFFQPRNGRSNTVSAAIRVALNKGLLVQSGKDGCGKPKYRAAPSIPCGPINPKSPWFIA